jgi:hypothetical protein
MVDDKDNKNNLLGGPPPGSERSNFEFTCGPLFRAALADFASSSSPSPLIKTQSSFELLAHRL